MASLSKCDPRSGRLAAYTLLVLLCVVGCRTPRINAPPAFVEPLRLSLPPEPPPAAKLSAHPTTIERGQSATLQWITQNADEVVILPGINRVTPNGSVNVSPPQSTIYKLVASGPGGRTEDTFLVE